MSATSRVGRVMAGGATAPASEDAAIVARMAKIGIVPGQDFDMRKLDTAVAEARQTVPKPAVERIMAHFEDRGGRR